MSVMVMIHFPETDIAMAEGRALCAAGSDYIPLFFGCLVNGEVTPPIGVSTNDMECEPGCAYQFQSGLCSAPGLAGLSGFSGLWLATYDDGIQQCPPGQTMIVAGKGCCNNLRTRSGLFLSADTDLELISGNCGFSPRDDGEFVIQLAPPSSSGGSNSNPGSSSSNSNSGTSGAPNSHHLLLPVRFRSSRWSFACCTLSEDGKEITGRHTRDGFHLHRVMIALPAASMMLL